MIGTRTLFGLVVLALMNCTAAGAGDAFDRIWFGGGIGVGFGDVDFVTIEPVVGYDATKRLSVGLGLVYRYSEDGRYDPELSTSDYGANVFARYSFKSYLFAHAEYEVLDYELRRPDGSEDRDRFDSLLAGPGFYRPLGRRTSFYGLALYNFNHDDEESPYDDPWTFRAGIAVGF